MNTIIITALVSVILTLVIGYFIWQFIGVRKLNKQVKDVQSNIHSLEEWIKNVDDTSYSNRQEIYDNIEKLRAEIYDEIKNNQDNVHFLDDTIHRELDKRFDKIYQQINT